MISAILIILITILSKRLFLPPTRVSPPSCPRLPCLARRALAKHATDTQN